MRTTTSSALVLFTTLLVAAPVSMLAATPEPVVLRDHVETGAGMLEGTGVLVDREGRGTDTVRRVVSRYMATVTEPQSLHLADVTVLSLRDRTVKVRFTLTGIPPAPFSATSALGQALVSVRVNILAVPRRY